MAPNIMLMPFCLFWLIASGNNSMNTKLSKQAIAKLIKSLIQVMGIAFMKNEPMNAPIGNNKAMHKAILKRFNTAILLTDNRVAMERLQIELHKVNESVIKIASIVLMLAVIPIKRPVMKNSKANGVRKASSGFLLFVELQQLLLPDCSHNMSKKPITKLMI